MIYFDNNATSHLDGRVAEVLHRLSHLRLANPASQHQDGRTARKLLEEARDQILKLANGRSIGMDSDQVLFTSGGTEANNLAVFGLLDPNLGGIVVSSIEHPSVLAAAEHLQSKGVPIRFLPVDCNGVARLDVLSSWLAEHRSSQDPTKRIHMVSLMLANNETGVLQPVAEAANLCREFKVLIHTDAVQAFGKIEVDFQKLNVDAMTITAHKIHGPVGIGALLLRRNLELKPQLFGGFQQQAFRPGTESTILACAFAEAAKIACAERIDRANHMQELRSELESKILSNCRGAVVHGASVPRLPHTTSVAFPPADRQLFQMALDVGGVACSTGSACASGSSQPSHVLQAMGLPDDIVKSSIRFSLSYATTQAEISDGVARIIEVHRALNG